MQIEIRETDDWIAVYKDGEKVWDNHSCPLRQGLEALGIEFRYVDLYDRIDYTGALSEATEVGQEGAEPFPERLP